MECAAALRHMPDSLATFRLRMGFSRSANKYASYAMKEMQFSHMDRIKKQKNPLDVEGCVRRVCSGLPEPSDLHPQQPEPGIMKTIKWEGCLLYLGVMPEAQNLRKRWVGGGT